MIGLKNFSIGYGDRILLDAVTSEFPSGKLTALIGRNGSGKSTMLSCLCGLKTDYSGSVKIEDKDIKKWNPLQLAKKLAFVNTQRPRIGNLKCEDVVALGRSPYTGWNGKLSSSDHRIINEALQLTGMKDYASRYFNSLSDGESQKIMIARAIAQETDIIILDEPTSFLDLPTRYELVTLLKRLTENQGKTILFSTHELDIALEKSDLIALIDNHTLHILPTSEMIKSGLIQRLFNTPDNYIDRFLSFLQQHPTSNQP